MSKPCILIPCEREEYDQVKLAAKLRRLSVKEYVKRAINAAMQSEGIDAVLFRESDNGT